MMNYSTSIYLLNDFDPLLLVQTWTTVNYSTSIYLLKLLVILYLLHQVILMYNVDDELEFRCAFISNELSVKTFKCQLIPVWYYNWSFLLVPILVMCSWVFSLIHNADWQPILNDKTSIAPWSLYSTFYVCFTNKNKISSMVNLN